MHPGSPTTESSPDDDRRPLALVGLFLAALVLALYWPSTGFAFLSFDDPVYVTQNPDVVRGLSGEGLVWAFNVGYAGNWHPLTWMSHMLDVELFGVDAGAAHRTNVLLHALNAVLVLLLFRRLLAMGMPDAAPAQRLAASGLAAACWAAHPLRLESVVWISERKDLLAGLFWLLATLAWLGYTRRPGSGRYLLAWGLFAVGLTAKPMLVTLPVVLCLLDIWPLRRIRSGGSRLWFEKLPWFALSVLSAIVTAIAQRRGGAISALETLPLTDRLSNALVATAGYLSDFVWPAALSAFYIYPVDGWPPWRVALSAALVAALSAVLLFRLARRPDLAVGWLWFCVTLVPVIGIVQVGLQARADRYTYLPHLGLFLLLVCAVLPWLRGGKLPRALPAALGCALLVALALATASQQRHWRDTISLFARAARVDPMNYMAHHALSIEHLLLDRTAEAEEYARIAVDQHPQFARGYEQLGAVLIARGRAGDAIDAYRTAIRLRPELGDAHLGLAQALLASGREEEAREALERAFAVAPELCEEARFLDLAVCGEGRKKK